MSFLLRPWHILLETICGLLNQRQQQIIEFQNTQIDALLKKLGRKRLLHDDSPRRMLAVESLELHCHLTFPRPRDLSDGDLRVIEC